MSSGSYCASCRAEYVAERVGHDSLTNQMTAGARAIRRVLTPLQRAIYVVHRTTMRYMSQPLSLRLPKTTVERLSARARRRRIPPRTLAQRYVEEGLRMDDHPLVRFADGPAGRHARLVGTRLAVWQVIEVVQDNGGDVAAATDYLELPLGLVQAAVTYYGNYSEEVDDWIKDHRRESEEAHAAWLTGQFTLRR